MSKKKRFRDTYLYRFLIITICFAMLIAPVATITFLNNVNDILKWVLLGVMIALYIASVIYTYVIYRKRQIS